jgi:hypothetical protein
MASDAGATPPVLTTVAIPGAYWRPHGPPIRSLALRPAGQEDALFLVDTAQALNATERASALLARCLVPPTPVAGSVTPWTPEALSVGDREACLLHLRRLTLGDRLEAVVRCPAAECSELLEVSVLVDELIVSPVGEPRREHRVRLSHGNGEMVVRFRLPTGGDLAAVAAISGTDPDSGAGELLERCVLGITRHGRHVTMDALGEEDRAEVAAAMADADPQALIEMELVCPACDQAVEVAFDAGAYLVAELEVRAAQLLDEVHALALHYHWSEAAILAMPPARRARYLKLVGLGDSTVAAPMPNAAPDPASLLP